MKLIFAINLSRKYSEMLTDEGIEKRLFSYYLLKDTDGEFLDEYINTGLLHKSKIKKENVDGSEDLYQYPEHGETSTSE